MADKENLRRRVRDLEQAVRDLEEKALPALRRADADQVAALSRMDGVVAALERRVEALEDENGAIPPVDPPEPPEPPQEQILSLADQQAIQRLVDNEDPRYALRFEGKRGFFSDWRKKSGDGPCPGKDDSKSCHEGPFESIAEAINFFFEKTRR